MSLNFQKGAQVYNRRPDQYLQEGVYKVMDLILRTDDSPADI